MTEPACRSGTLTNVLPHWNGMPQIWDTASHPVTVYRHRAGLSLVYPLMWNVTLEYTTTSFNVLGQTWPFAITISFPSQVPGVMRKACRVSDPWWEKMVWRYNLVTKYQTDLELRVDFAHHWEIEWVELFGQVQCDDAFRVDALHQYLILISCRAQHSRWRLWLSHCWKKTLSHFSINMHLIYTYFYAVALMLLFWFSLELIHNFKRFDWLIDWLIH